MRIGSDLDRFAGPRIQVMPIRIRSIRININAKPMIKLMNYIYIFLMSTKLLRIVTSLTLMKEIE
jgi:hypothetical protein